MPVSARDDHADAVLVLEVAHSLRRWSEATGRRPPTKVLREAVWFFWQQPRLVKPLIRSKYSRSARWSPDAAALANSAADLRGLLVIEHIEPMNGLLRWLIDDAHEACDVMRRLQQGLEVVVVTSDESKRLSHDGSADERYRAAGLDLALFEPLP